MLAESEARTQLAMLVECIDLSDEDRTSVQDSIIPFLDELTGGDFGAGSPVQDVARCSRIAGQGASLRGTLLRIRQTQLKRAAGSRIWNAIKEVGWLKGALIFGGLLFLAAYLWLIIVYYGLLFPKASVTK